MSSRPPAAQSGSPTPAQALPGPGARAGRSMQIEKARDVRSTLRRLLATLKPYWPAMIVVFILVAIGTVLGLVAPYLIGRAIDRFIGGGDRPGLLRMALSILACYAGSWITQIGQSLLMTDISQKVMRGLRRQLFEHLQTLSLSFFDRHPHGELMSRLTNDLDAVGRVIAENSPQLFSGILTIAGILGMMLALNLWLTLGSMFVFPLMMWLVGFVGQRTRKGFREYQMRIGQLNGRLEEMFSGQRVILAFGQQESMLAQFDHANQEAKRAGIQAQNYAMLVPPLMGILSNANIAIVAGLGGWMTLRGRASVGTIAAFISYSRTFANPLRFLGDLYNQIQSAIAGAERVFELIDQPPEQDAPDALPLTTVAGHVEFDRVSFAYVPGVPVIKKMSFEAQPGQTIALVGPTGAGKTTMVNLLSRFYDVDDGSIRIDGIDIRRLKKADLRRQLGVVLQDTYLFADTVMENIRYGRLDATDEEVIAAAKLANADQFITRLPHGYQTMLSERAGNLSQGQRQLLAIARAILADPAILILDEATSSVDTRTEMLIQEGLLRLMQGRTSFVIAHRLSTIREADCILVINNGEIIERGTHRELLDKGGFYYNLYMSQFKGQTVLV